MKEEGGSLPAQGLAGETSRRAGKGTDQWRKKVQRSGSGGSGGGSEAAAAAAAWGQRRHEDGLAAWCGSGSSTMTCPGGGGDNDDWTPEKKFIWSLNTHDIVSKLSPNLLI